MSRHSLLSSALTMSRYYFGCRNNVLLPFSLLMSKQSFEMSQQSFEMSQQSFEMLRHSFSSSPLTRS